MTGCSVSSTAGPFSPSPDTLHGGVHGGQQPIVGAHVYLFAANNTGYGGSNLAATNPNSSISLLSIGANTAEDGNGDFYVTTDLNGSFTITGDYTCTAGQQVYLYAVGGDPGAGENAAVGLLAILGNCPGSSFSASSFIFMDEASTVVAAYSFAGFASDATHVSSSGTTLAGTGIANAFASAANLADLSTGTALAITPAGNGAVPQTTINTIADILASCINSTGPNSTGCTTLFDNIQSTGSTGTNATDTATTAIYLAHNPYPGSSQMANLYGNFTASAPFAPTLTTQPSDFTIGINFTGDGLSGPSGIAIDRSGDAWIENFYGNSVTELSSSGVALSGPDGYTGGGMSEAYGIAIDGAGNAWIANYVGNTITELSNSGTILSGANGYTGGGLNEPYGIAIDGSGNAWIANNGNNSVTKLSGTGSVLSDSGSGAFTSSSLSQPVYIAIDGSGNAWIANYGNNRVTELTSLGSVLSGSNGYTGRLNAPFGIALDSAANAWIANRNGNSVSELANSGSALSGFNDYTGGGLGAPYGIAIDGSGNAWIANYGNSSVTELAPSGLALSGPNGYTSGDQNSPKGIAIDGSGNVWISNIGNSSVTELIGSATPVITPIAGGLPATPSGDGSSRLGTRP